MIINLRRFVRNTNSPHQYKKNCMENIDTDIQRIWRLMSGYKRLKNQQERRQLFHSSSKFLLSWFLFSWRDSLYQPKNHSSKSRENHYTTRTAIITVLFIYDHTNCLMAIIRKMLRMNQHIQRLKLILLLEMRSYFSFPHARLSVRNG